MDMKNTKAEIFEEYDKLFKKQKVLLKKYNDLKAEFEEFKSRPVEPTVETEEKEVDYSELSESELITQLKADCTAARAKAKKYKRKLKKLKK